MSKKCPFCAEKVQGEAVVCKHCGKQLAETGLEKKEYQWTGKRIGCAALFGLFVIMVISAAADSNTPNVENKNLVQQEVVEDKKIPTNNKLSVGEEGMINNNTDLTNCQGKTVLGVTKEDQEAYMKVAVIKDNEGFVDLLLEGRIFLVNNCSKIRKLDSSGLLGSVAKVRILNPEEGQKYTVGWTPYEFAIKSN